MKHTGTDVRAALIDGAWLQARLHDPRIFILQCDQAADPASGPDPRFEAGHIPGARQIDLQADFSDPDHRHRLMRPRRDAFAATLRRLGVNRDSQVVLASTGKLSWATRAWWVLRSFGFDGAVVLDGGLPLWKAEGRALESGPAQPALPGNIDLAFERDILVGKEAVQAALADDGARVINALTPARHSGQERGNQPRAGRIAGSINIPEGKLLDKEGRLLPAGQLKPIFERAGIAPGTPSVVYCGGGIAATAVAFALASTGHEDVVVYDASLQEWAADPALPMATGD